MFKYSGSFHRVKMADRQAYETRLATLLDEAKADGLKLSYKLTPIRARGASTPFTVDFERDGVIYTASWNRRLLSNGASKIQADWDASKIASSVTYFDSIKNAGEKLTARFNKDFADFYMMTSTRNFVKPDGSVDVVHNWSTPNAVTLENALEVGPNGWLDELADAEKITQTYFGTKDVDNVANVIQKVTGQKPYLWRINSKPGQVIERPVVLGLVGYVVGFVIGAYGVSNYRPARGVALTRKN